MNIQSIVISTLLCSLMLACAPEEEEESEDGSSGQTISELAGDHQKCFIFSGVGSVFSGKAYTLIYWLNDNGTFTYDIRFSDADSCATEFTAGGSEVAVYTVSGTFTADGASEDDPDATKVTFNVLDVDMTIRTHADYENGLEFAQRLNSTCTPSPDFADDGTSSTKAFSGKICLQDSLYTFPTAAYVGDTYLNILRATGSHLSIGATNDLYAPGSSAYPTEFAEQLLSFY